MKEASSSSWDKVVAARDAKNLDDSIQIDLRIMEALRRASIDKRLKVSDPAIAKAANCSRNTLLSRVWAVIELKKIRDARKAKSLKDSQGEETESLEVDDGVKGDLNKALVEALRWKARCEAISEDLTDLERALARKVGENAELKSRLDRLALNKSGQND